MLTQHTARTMKRSLLWRENCWQRLSPSATIVLNLPQSVRAHRSRQSELISVALQRSSPSSDGEDLRLSSQSVSPRFGGEVLFLSSCLLSRSGLLHQILAETFSSSSAEKFSSSGHFSCPSRQAELEKSAGSRVVLCHKTVKFTG